MALEEKYDGREIPLSWFARSLWKFAPLYLEIIFLAICLRLIGLVEPFVFQVIIDRVLPFEREASLVVVVVVFIGVSLFQMGFEILAALLGLIATNKVAYELGSRLFGHLFKLPLSHFRRWSVGETLARIRETETIRDFLVETTTGVFLDLLFMFIYIAVLFTISVKLTWIVLIALPLQALIFFIFGPILRRRLSAEFDAGAKHQAQMVENISGVAAVKALSSEDIIINRLGGTLKKSLTSLYHVEVLNIVADKLTFIVERGVTISIVFLGSTLVFAGEITLGQLIAFHLLAEKVTDPISKFSQLWENWQNLKISRRRLGDIINSETEKFQALPNLPESSGAILTFENVSFSYNSGEPFIENLSFAANPRTLTLVTGPSGIGKSTFGRLAAGIEAPQAGVVRLGGLDISEFDPHDVRTKIAYVPQEPYLFSGTLRDNLLLGGKGKSDLELREALKVAAADSLLHQLPNGFDTDVGERGSALSGGQRQRVGIARSVLKESDILILDEPSSALDEESRRTLVDQLNRLRASTTLIVITHNPDLFDSPDQVVEFG